MRLLPDLSMETWTLLILFLTLLILYGIWPYGVFKKLGIPGPRPLPFIGTFHAMRNGIYEWDMECFKKYGNVWGLYDGRVPVLVVLDTAIIKTVLVKECFTLFTNKRFLPLAGPLESALVMAEDEQWKRIRTVLSPTFTSGKLKQMFPLIKHYGDLLVKNVQKKVDSKQTSFNMKAVFGAYSMDVVLSTSFSVNVDSINNPNDPFVTNSNKLFKFSLLSPLMLITTLFPFLIPVLKKLNVCIFPMDILNFFMDAIKNIKEKRQKGIHKDRVDFLQLMVDSQTNGEENHGYKELSDTEIMAQALIFILAGHESTSTTLMFVAYNLAVHPDVQSKLQEEIDRVLPNKAPPTYEALMQMEYMDMVINESFRLYTGAGRIERLCKKTTEINGVTIPEGAVVAIPVFVLHQNPEIWPEPEEFRPERFSQENRESRDPYTFMPFGVGPRNCIGMRFALLNMKLALTVLLQNFTFRTCKDTPIPLELDTRGPLKTKKPVILDLVPRPSQKTNSEM
ncbi:cytochrome P450 3A24-like [Discoglossus pictus]